MFIGRSKEIQSLNKFKDKHFIKILTGLRRCGKSSILQTIYSNINDNKIIYDFNDSRLVKKFSWEKLISDIESKSIPDKINYLFLDEIQEIKKFENCVITLFEHKTFKYDIYLTGSNSHMFSEELATLFTGRNIEFSIYPLTFQEIKNALFPEIDNEIFLNTYLKNGGLGNIIEVYNDEITIKKILFNIMNDITTKDIIKRKNIVNIEMFLKIRNYVFLNFGRVLNSNNIANYIQTNNHIVLPLTTILRYLTWLCESLLIYQVNFYDTKNKSVLKTKCKYYAGDLGLLNSIIGYDINLNRGYRIENLVFLQLKSLDYEIYTSIDKNNHEIDFIIKKNNEIIYIQVAEILTDENFERESRSLLEVKDAFKKIIICKVDNVTHLNNTGIKIINLFEWLNGEVNFIY